MASAQLATRLVWDEDAEEKSGDAVTSWDNSGDKGGSECSAISPDLVVEGSPQRSPFRNEVNTSYFSDPESQTATRAAKKHFERPSGFVYGRLSKRSATQPPHSIPMDKDDESDIGYGYGVDDSDYDFYDNDLEDSTGEVVHVSRETPAVSRRETGITMHPKPPPQQQHVSTGRLHSSATLAVERNINASGWIDPVALDSSPVCSTRVKPSDDGGSELSSIACTTVHFQNRASNRHCRLATRLNTVPPLPVDSFNDEVSLLTESSIKPILSGEVAADHTSRLKGSLVDLPPSHGVSTDREESKAAFPLSPSSCPSRSAGFDSETLSSQRLDVERPTRTPVPVQITRTVREKPYRGMPLLLQCTGHVETPTRVIVVSVGSDSESDTDGAGPRGDQRTHPYVDEDEGGTPSLIERGVRTRSRSPSSPYLSTTDRHTTTLPVVSNVPLSGTPAAATTSSYPYTTHIPSPSIQVNSQPNEGQRECLVPPYYNNGYDEKAALDSINASVYTEILDNQDYISEPVLCSYSVEPITLADGGNATEGQWAHPSYQASDPHTVPRGTGSDGFHFTPSSSLQDMSHGILPAPHHMTLPSRSTAQWHDPGLVLDPPLSQLPANISANRKERMGSWQKGAVGVESAFPAGYPADFYEIVDVVESVEETSTLHNTPPVVCAFDPYRWSSPQSRGQGHYRESVSTPQVSHPSSNLLTKVLQRHHRGQEVVHRLLDTHLHRPLSGTPFGRVVPASVYLKEQRQQRAEQLSLEAEQMRLQIAYDVCQATYPYARELLLLFLLLVEETDIHQRRRSRKSPSFSHTAANSVAESLVTFELCAQAVNTVLQRHSVKWIRATRELCARVVTWCRAGKDGGWGLNREDSEEDRVEYTSFVSSVMQFASEYPFGRRGC